MTADAKSGDGESLAGFSDISVIVPAFMAHQTLERAIASVMRQSSSVREIIVVDDASPESLEPLVREVAARYERAPVRYVRLPRNSGPSAARNAGIRVASGKYIGFLDADDEMHEQKCALSCALLESRPDLEAVAHRTGYELSEQTWQGSRSMDDIKPVAISHLLFANVVGGPNNVTMRNSGRFQFDETMRYCEDMMLWIEMLAGGASIARSNAILARTHKAAFGASGLSSNLAAMWRGELDCIRRISSARGGLGVRIVGSAWATVRYCRRVLLSRLRDILQ